MLIVLESLRLLSSLVLEIAFYLAQELTEMRFLLLYIKESSCIYTNGLSGILYVENYHPRNSVYNTDGISLHIRGIVNINLL